MPDFRQALEPLNREHHARFTDNPLQRVDVQPFSTFSIDVDTGACNALAREDFGNDRLDAGEIGAGHPVTAIYEVALAGSRGERLGAGLYQPRARRQGRPGK